MVVAGTICAASLRGQDFVWTPTSAPGKQWQFVPSSSDGTILMAAGNFPSAIYTSTNSGLAWAPSVAPTVVRWNCGASSANGRELVAAVGNGAAGGIYISTNSGLTWTQTGAPNLNWWSVASSSDGTRLVAAAGNDVYGNGGIYTSTNSGFTWTQTSAPGSQSVFYVASSS